MRTRLLAALVLTLVSPLAAEAQQTAGKRPPNVVFILADDLAPYVLGCYGNKTVRTPNIDKLASQGLRFNHAYCSSPVCTASRQSFITGKYPRTVGVTQLKTPLPDGEQTLGVLLKRAGYNTAAIGKMHFNSNLKHGFDVRLDLPEYRAALKARGAKPLPKGVDVLGQWKPFKDPAPVWLNARALPYPAVDEDMAGTYFARESIAYLKQQKNRSEPFFLICSFTEPHSPFHFPVEFRGRHKPASFPAPKVGQEDDWHRPAIFRDVTPEETQGIWAAYCTSVEFLDRNVGLVLDMLEELGLAEDTLVVFLGDHGYLLGHHGRFEKHVLFTEAIRAPLIIRARPRFRPGRQTDALVEFVDLVPTVLDYTGQPIPKAVQGKSLLGLLDGKTDKHKEAVFVEYSENEEATIVTPRWQLIYGTGKRARQDGYETGKPLPGRTVMLYDNLNDPGQFTNLAGKQEHAKLVAELTRQLAEHLRLTARQPELLPRTDDVHALLEHCLQPRDVESQAKKK